MEQPRSPWSVSENSPVAELEFKRKVLADLHNQIKSFAKKEDLAYEAEEGDDQFSILPEDSDRQKFSTYLEATLATLNALLDHQGKHYVFITREDKGRLVIESKDA